MGLFGAKPPSPQPLPPPPTFADTKVQSQGLDPLKAGGVQSTIMTSGKGDLTTPNLTNNSGKKTVLG